MRFDLSDEEWAVLGPLMPETRKSGRADDRKIMNAIFYVLRTGMPWRDLPERYGPYTTAYNRFNRWSGRGVWKRIFDTLASKSRNSLYMIDSTKARTRRARRFRSPAMPNGRCRMHGGLSPGAPKGNRNAFKHGRYTAEAIARRREIAELVSAMKALARNH